MPKYYTVGVYFCLVVGSTSAFAESNTTLTTSSFSANCIEELNSLGVKVSEGARNRPRVDINLKVPGEISFLFYRGALPPESKRNDLRSNMRVIFIRNEQTEVVAILSLSGMPHLKLKDFIPAEDIILGGTRYIVNDKTVERINSVTFRNLRGLAQDAGNFEIRVTRDTP